MLVKNRPVLRSRYRLFSLTGHVKISGSDMALPRDSAKCSVRECVITLTIFFALQLDSLLSRLALLAMAALSLAVLSVTAEQDGYVSPQPTWRDVETPPPRPRPFLRRRALSDEMHYYPTDYAMPRPPWGGVWGMCGWGAENRSFGRSVDEGYRLCTPLQLVPRHF